MEKIHGNMHVFVLSCKFLTCKHKNMRVSMYFLHLELTFTFHYIVMEGKGLLRLFQRSWGQMGPKGKNGLRIQR